MTSIVVIYASIFFIERRKAVNLFEKKTINPLLAIYIMNKIGLKLTENTLKHENMQKLMKSGEKFDAVIVGQFMNDALKGLAYHFGGHLILFSSVGTSTWVSKIRTRDMYSLYFLSYNENNLV